MTTILSRLWFRLRHPRSKIRLGVDLPTWRRIYAGDETQAKEMLKGYEEIDKAIQQVCGIPPDWSKGSQDDIKGGLRDLLRGDKK